MSLRRRSLLRLVAGAALLGGKRAARADGPGPVGTAPRDGERFRNLGGITPPGLGALLRWQLARAQGPWPAALPATTPAALPASVGPGEVAVTLINHATFLLQFAGRNVLTDPIWSERCSPVPWAGPRRVHPPGVPLEALPRIDVVLLSHNHYDHLDLATLAALQARHRPRVVTGLGQRELLAAAGITDPVELDWWGEHDLGEGHGVTFTPAQHFSARGLFDRNLSLWGGFALRAPRGAVYFAGDSGYAPLFREIGGRLGPFAVALLPIGAYRPRWFMSALHCDPEEAVRAHRDVRARRSLAMHFGCFPLADDGYGEPAAELEVARRNAGITAEEFALPVPGRTLRFPL
jgi:L-ascorbate metabolism protein UlaG (beta-lactamase superfamily)